MNPNSPFESSSSSTSSSQLPAFGTSYNPATQHSQFAGCYRPQPPHDYSFQPQPQYPYYQPQPFSTQQPFPPQQPYYQPQPFSTQQPQFPPFSSQPLQLQDSPPLSPSPPPSSSRGKGKYVKPKKTAQEKSTRASWSEAESLFLCKSWIHVSEDPTVSTNQRADTFWYKILALHTERYPNKNRTKDALTGKWEFIRKRVSKFNGIYSQLIQGVGRASGTSDADLLSAALAEYQSINLTTFTLISCWEFLKDKQKFINPDPCVIGRRNRKRGGGQTSEAPLNVDDEDEDVAATYHATEDRVSRPPGRPRPQKSQKSSSSSAKNSASNSPAFYDNINLKLSELQTSRDNINLDIQRAERAKTRNLDLEFLRTKLEDYPPEMHQHIEHQKKRIMDKFASGFYDI